MNIVRNGLDWFVIDLDAACKFGDPLGYKWSSAYMPPEAIYIGYWNGKRVIMVKSLAPTVEEGQRRVNSPNAELPYEPLLADPSFDIWSLGCIFYQLCTGASLFKEMYDDNLSDDFNDPDGLWILASWDDPVKDLKLSKIADPLGRNLASLMLTKDPLRRATISRICTHPFFTGKKVARLPGMPAKYHVFLSYRVNSDLQLATLVYEMLTHMGLTVWWDKMCLEPGLDWKDGFCEGLVNSRIFVCLWSREAINHPTNDRQSFATLTENSISDNVLLENQLANELRSLQFIERIFPVLIGDYDSNTDSYSDFFKTGCFPRCPDVSVKAVLSDVRTHMSSQALGSPLFPDITVKALMEAISSCQGGFLRGKKDEAMRDIVDKIRQMVRNTGNTH